MRNAETLDTFYQDEYEYNPPISKEASRPYEARLKLLRPYLNNQNTRFLEIGCGAGHFIKYAKPYVKELIGLELNKAQAEYCRKTYNVDVSSEQIEKFQPHGQFDVVCCFQVLEHVPHPVDFLRTVLRFVKPNGILVLDVPNSNEPLLNLYRVAGFQEFYFRKSHLFYYNTKSLSLLFKESGIKRYEIKLLQGYSLTNHFHWLYLKSPQPSVEVGYNFVLPGNIYGDEKVKMSLKRFFNKINDEYMELLIRNGFSDTLWAIINRG